MPLKSNGLIFAKGLRKVFGRLFLLLSPISEFCRRVGQIDRRECTFIMAVLGGVAGVEFLKKLWKEWILPLGLEVLVIVFLLKVVFMLVLVPTGSMLPTISEKSLLFCTYVHNTDSLQRGQILVFRSDEKDKVLIKRLIGLPGETVTIKGDGSVLVDGQMLSEPYVVYPLGGPEMEFDVPEGCYLFLGDNRANSEDARYWEDPFIPGEKIKARARFVLWPFSNFGVLS